MVFSAPRNDNALATPAWSPGPDYGDYEVECYALPNAAAATAYAAVSAGVPTLVPLDSYFNAAMNDTWALAADQSRREAEARGYTKTATLGFIQEASSGVDGATALPTVFKLTFA